MAAVLLLVVLGQQGMQAYTMKSQALEEEIALRQLQYDKYSRIIRKSKDYLALNKALEKFRQDLLQSSFVWDETPSLSEARFQNLIKELAAANQVNVRLTKVLPRKTVDGLTLLQLNVNCRAEIGAIRDFLLAVQKNSHYLFFHKLEIKTISRREKRYYYLNAELMALTGSLSE